MGVLIGFFCLQFHSDFGNLVSRWNEGDFSYCYIVPLIFLYLVYSNRDALMRLEIRPSMYGAAVLLLAGFLFIAGRLGSVETLVYTAMWLSVVGTILLLFGLRIAAANAFPLFMLAFIVPVPPFLNQLLTFRLKLVASSMAVSMCHAIGISALREGNIIDLGNTQLQVADACSGMRYLFPILLSSFLVAYFVIKPWWKRLLVILTSIPIALFSNALRITLTAFLTLHVSKEAAEGVSHELAGFVIYILSLAFLFFVSILLKKIGVKDTPSNASGNTSSGAQVFRFVNMKISHVWIAAVLFILFWGVSMAVVAAQMTPARKNFKEFPTTIGSWSGEKTYLDEDVMNSLWADDYVMIRFRNAGTGDSILLFVPYYSQQGTMHTAHSPVSCLVGSGYAPVRRDILNATFPPPFGKSAIRQMVLERDGQFLLVNYWFQERGRILNDEYRNKWYLFWDSVTRHRTDGALVRLEMPLAQGQSPESAQIILDGFTVELMEILPYYVPG